MDRNEKKRLRNHIGGHLDVSKSRLTDAEAIFLKGFVDDYGKRYKGRSTTRERIHDGWSSNGRFTRKEEFTDTFTDTIGIRLDYSSQDDDGQTRTSSTVIEDARGILDWFRHHRQREKEPLRDFGFVSLRTLTSAANSEIAHFHPEVG